MMKNAILKGILLLYINMKKNIYIRLSMVYVLAGILLVSSVTIGPLTLLAFIREEAPGTVQFPEGLHSDVLEHRAERREQRRLYTRIVDRCRKNPYLSADDAFCKIYAEAENRCLERQGMREDTGCPDINDPVLYEAFETHVLQIDATEDSEEGEAHPAAPSTSSLQTDDLSDRDRLMLRRYERARTCPTTLKDYLPGFYELCLSLVGKSAAPDPIRGMLNDLANLKQKKAAPMPTLKLRRELFLPARPDR